MIALGKAAHYSLTGWDDITPTRGFVMVIAWVL